MRIRRFAFGGILTALVACGGGSGGGGDGDGAGAGGGAGGGEPPSTNLVSLNVIAPSTLVPGGSSTQFEVVITNPGTAPARDVAATLSLGDGLTLEGTECNPSAGATCPANPNALQIASLPAGGSLHFAVTAFVALGASGQIVSTASVTASGESVTGDNTAQFVIEAYSADVKVTTSTTDGEYVSGGLATYSMTLSNVGPDAARDVTLQNVFTSDQVPSAVDCTASGATCPGTFSPVITIARLPSGGSLKYEVSASIPPTAFGPISYTLYASSAGDPLSSNNVATSSAYVRVPVSPESATFVALRSESGDVIGNGQSYDYDGTNAVIDVAVDGVVVSVDVTGDQKWRASFALPDSLAQLTPGTYSNLSRYPFSDPAAGGLDWRGESRACNTIVGTITIDSVTYVAGSLATLDLRFRQQCDGAAASLHGQIHWNADDDTLPPGPVNPAPAGLWSPPPGATPEGGNFVYLQSDGLEFIGDGGTFTYTSANAIVRLAATENYLSVQVDGDEWWLASFQGMNSISELQPGYYANLKRYPFHNPATGGFSWSGEGRACNQLGAWVVIDNVAYAGGSLASLDLRFQQHCENDTPALRGVIHWRADDTTQPPGPQFPPPSNLWAPSPGATPPSGNYVYLESEPDDYVGGAGTYTYTQADSLLDVSTNGARLEVGITGDEYWMGQFQGMNTLTRLEPGYYGGLQRFPFHNPATGGLSWIGEGRGCNQLSGWFVVDGVSYVGDALAAIDLRFEQVCQDGPLPYGALHGEIHWSVDDPTRPPGPEYPPPPELWMPPPDAVPASGNYVYLESESGDSVGRGQTYTYTGADAILMASLLSRRLRVTVTGDERWTGEFVAMSTLDQLELGYYGNVQRYPLHNPVKGGMSWGAASCPEISGWFVIDDLTVTDGALESVDLRFEQYCGDGAALRGAVHWSVHDTTQPPGPQSPPPPALWSPAAGTTPASGNYVYLQSDPNDYIGRGLTYTATASNATITITEVDGHLSVDVRSPTEAWYGDFQVMNTLTEFVPGYYGDLQRYPFHNPTKGGLAWIGGNRGCNSVSGWFVVDSVTYAAGELASIDLRFEQHCESATPALHGEIHWIK